MMKRTLAVFLFLLSIQLITFAQTKPEPPKDIVSTREMDRINWMEFKEVVPSKINTVLLPTGDTCR